MAQRTKKRFFLLSWVSILCVAGFSQQEIKLSDIHKPGDVGTAERKGIVLAENLYGPQKLIFSGHAPGCALPALSREERGKPGRKGSFEKLTVLFSGRIYSPNIAEPVIFENKTPEELILLEIPVFPVILEHPYGLFMDLTIRAGSKPKGRLLSEAAGSYQAVLIVTVKNL